MFVSIFASPSATGLSAGEMVEVLLI